MDTNIPDENEVNKQRIAVTAGLLATSTLAVIQMLPITSLDLSLKASVLFFSISMPMLAFDVSLTYYELSRHNSFRTIPRRLLRFFGYFVTIFGFTMLFWHFELMYALVFLLSSTLFILVWRRLQTSLKTL